MPAKPKTPPPAAGSPDPDPRPDGAVETTASFVDPPADPKEKPGNRISTLVEGRRYSVPYPERIPMPKAQGWQDHRDAWQLGVLVGMAGTQFDMQTGDGMLALAVALGRVPGNVFATEEAVQLQTAAGNYVRAILKAADPTPTTSTS